MSLIPESKKKRSHPHPVEMNLAISIRHCSQTYRQKPDTTQNHHLGDMAIPPLYLERDKCRCTMTDA